MLYINFDNKSQINTMTKNEVLNNSSYIEQEASASEINDEQLFYLMSRGLNKQNAIQMIMMGFIEPFSRELKMEYAIEFNHLLKT